MTSLVRRGLQRIRDAATARLQQSERGITLVLFAMAMIAVIGMVAVGVDGGRIYDERRHAQNAADHAALAAAYASCTSTLTDPAALQGLAEAAGLASALGNGYDDGTTNDVTIDVVTGGADHTYEAQIDTTIDTTFAKVIGFATMDTNAYAEATATGCDETGGGNPAIHAGGHECPGGSLRNVEISGNDHTVNGMTRTYGSFHNGGDRSDFLNPGLASVEYGGTFTAGPPFNVYDGSPSLVSPLPADRWPDGFDPVTDMTDTMWNAYRDARTNIASLTPSTFNIPATGGIFYTERTSGTININAIADGAQFIVVSKFRPITIPNGYTGRTFHAYPNNPLNTPDDLMFISGFSHAQPCDQFALERSGEGGTWNGIFWTPRAMSRWSGNLSTINGGFVTWAFQMNGNEHVINGGTGQPAAVPDVLLTQ